MSVRSAEIAAALLSAVWIGCGPAPATPSASPHAPPSPSRPELVDPAVLAAVERARAAVLAAPDDADARFALAATFDANALHDLAAATYAQVLALEPGHARAQWHLARMDRAMGLADDALASAHRALLLAPDESALKVRVALWLLDGDHRERAAALLDEAVARAPTDADVRLARARLALARADASTALREIDAALGADPGSAYAHFLRGTALLRRGAAGDDEAARRAFDAAGEDSGAAWPGPDPWEAEVNVRKVGFHADKAALRARLDELLERGTAPGDAEFAELDRLRAAVPDDLGLLADHAQAVLASRGPRAAADLLARAAADRPENPRILLMLGAALERTGEIAGALEHTRRAVALHPGYAAGHVRLGQLRLAQQDMRGAAASFAEARRLGVVNESMQVQLGLLLRSLDRHDEALAAFECAAADHPDSFEAHVLLARAAAGAGTLAQARKAFDRARSLRPDGDGLAELGRRLDELESSTSGAGTSR